MMMGMSNKENVDDIKKTMMTEDIIIRLSGQGQYRVSKNIVDKIDKIDDSIVNILENIDSNIPENKGLEQELREKIMEMVHLITSGGKQLENKEIVQSSIIIPSQDISIEEAKTIFKGEGVIQDI
jgi:hypothetical protein